MGMNTSEARVNDYLSHERMIRSLKLKLDLLEHGLAMPRDDDAIARIKAALEKARCSTGTNFSNPRPSQTG
jgi:hypothetical protein